MKARILVACAFVLAAAGQALAAATGGEIRAAISDSTVQGSMDSTGPYAEYYERNGTIKGKDYSGQWSVEGDLMCFVFPDTPKECWNVEINGDQLRWVKNGASQGTGTIVHGNPNGFTGQP